MGCNPNRGIELSKELKRRNLKSKFAIECRANDVEKENFRALKEVGLVSVFLGIESGSNNVLKRYNKEIMKEINSLSDLMKLYDENCVASQKRKNDKKTVKHSICILQTSEYERINIYKIKENGYGN